MRAWCRFTAIGVLTAGLMLALGSSPSMAQSRAHVYLLRGLMNIFSLGMDTLCGELNKRGVYATVHNHSEWQGLANRAAENYKAGKEGPIILIGHSLGADAVMEMAGYLGRKGVPVALVVPFDGTGSYPAPSNVARVLNLTQRDYAYMRRGPGFHGSLANVDVSSDSSIDHLNIDKSPRLHARVISEVLAIVGGGHRIAAPSGPSSGPKPASVIPPASGGEEVGTKVAPATVGEEVGTKAAPAGEGSAQPEATPSAPAAPATPAKSGDGAMNSTETMKPALADSGTPIIALPERRRVAAGSGSPVTPTPRKPVAAPQPVNPAQLPN